MSIIRTSSGILIVLVLTALITPTFAVEIQHFIDDKKYAGIFADASGLAIRNDGVVYVSSQAKGSLLQIIDGNIESFKLTSGVFKDSDLGGVGILANGNLVVVNEGSGKVAVLDRNREVLKRFARSGDDPGELDGPGPVTVSVNNNIYVGDAGNKQITVFNDQGLFLHSFGRHGSGGKNIRKPTHISLDAEENIYVLEGADRLSIFDRQGNLIDRVTAKDFRDQFNEKPEFTAMTVDLNGTLYLADLVTSQVILVDWRNRKVLSKFGALGQSRTQYRYIAELAVNNRGQIAILDNKNKKVEVFQLDETEFAKPKVTDLLQFSRHQKSSCRAIHSVSSEKNLCIKRGGKGIVMLSADGEELGEFATEVKKPLTLDSDGKTVAILEGNKMHVYDTSGKSIFTLGRYGSAPGGFKDPAYVFIHNGQYYVSDIGNNRVQVFSDDGQFVEEIKAGKGDKKLFINVGPLAVDSQSRLYIADKSKAGMIRVIDKDRNLLTNIGLKGDSIHKVTRFKALDIDKQDRLYLLAGTEFNRFEVTIFKDFKPFKKFGGATKNGSDIYFSEVKSMSVASADTNSIHLNDTELKRHYRFDLLEFPDAAFGLKIAANKKQLMLSWSSSRSPLITAYEIQAAKTQHGPFKNRKHNI